MSQRWPQAKKSFHNLRHSLRTRIVTWSFVPTFIILAAVALVTFLAYRQVTETLVIERDRELVRLAAGQLATDLNDDVALLAEVARSLTSDDLATQRVALSAAANRLAIFDGGALLLNQHGRIVAAEPARPDLLGRDFSNRSYFGQVRRTMRPFFSEVHEEWVEFSAVVTIAVPIVGANGEFRGLLAGMYGVGEHVSNGLYSRIVRLHSGADGSTYLVDGNGRAIFHTTPRRIGDHLGSRAAVRALGRGETGAMRTYEYFDVELIAAYAPVPGTPWGLVTEENWAFLLRTSQGYWRFLWLLLLLGALVPPLVVTIGVRRITRPIAGLIASAQAIAAGRYGQTIDVRTGDELEALAQQFNVMSAELQASYAHLEQRVADRTRELTALNDITAVVSRSLDLETVLQSALEKTLAVVAMPAGEAFRLDEARSVLVRMASCGLSRAPQPGLELPAPGDVSHGANGAAGPLVHLLSDNAPGPAFGEQAMLWRQEGWRQVVTVPLVAKAQTLGLMVLGNSEVRPLSPEELSLLAAVGQQVGVAVENASLYRQAEQLAVLQERQRLARDLHDSVTQALYSLTLLTGATGRLLATGETETAATYVQDMRQTAQEALQEMRLLIFELRSPVLEQEGLAAALQTRLEAVEQRSGLKVVWELEDIGRLPAAIENGLYRIAQEALNNVLKHAQARQVSLSLRRHGQAVMLEVVDDGVGFEPGQMRGGLGLPGMAERADQFGGVLTVWSHPGEGTRIKVEVCQ